MRARFTLLLAVLVATFSPLAAMSEEKQIEGTVIGYHCAVNNIGCPADMEDPVIANESIFVVSTGDKTWFFVPNVDRAILARHITQKVRVSGDFNAKYNAIQAKSIEVQKGDAWKVVWSKALEDEFRAKFGSVPSGK